MIPRISIIIPVYRVEEYIIMCLQSVANQTVQDGIECILVDDCGGDNSINIAKSFIDNYKGEIDFKIVYREKNGGLSAARNTGIEAARGVYIYFIDSDDEIDYDCLQMMWQMIEKYGYVDLIKGSFYEENESKNIRSVDNMPEYSTDRSEIKNFLLKYEGDLIPAQSKLVKRDFLVKNKLFFREGIIHEDNYWSFFLAKYVTSLCCCPKAIYKHRYNPSSITGNVNIQKEKNAFSIIIEELSYNIDPFMNGSQKEYILYNFLTAYNNYCFEKTDKNRMLSCIKGINSIFENVILKIYLQFSNKRFSSKILHLLILLYKM